LISGCDTNEFVRLIAETVADDLIVNEDGGTNPSVSREHVNTYCPGEEMTRVKYNLPLPKEGSAVGRDGDAEMDKFND